MITYSDMMASKSMIELESAVRYLLLEMNNIGVAPQMKIKYDFTGYNITKTKTDHGTHIIGHDSNGALRFDMHIDDDGNLHNPNGPALETWNCRLRRKDFFVSNPHHVFTNNTTVTHDICYYIRGTLHRIDGPATIITNEGETKLWYWVNGQYRGEMAFLKQYMPDKWLEMQMQKVYYICGKKCRISTTLPNGNFILEPIKT